MKTYHEVTLREKDAFGRLGLYNKGYIRAEKNFFEGFLTFDYIQATYDNKILKLKYFDYDSKRWHENDLELKLFEFPSVLAFYDITTIYDSITIWKIEFSENIKDKKTQNKIDKIIETLKQKSDFL